MTEPVWWCPECGRLIAERNHDIVGLHGEFRGWCPGGPIDLVAEREQLEHYRGRARKIYAELSREAQRSSSLILMIDIAKGGILHD